MSDEYLGWHFHTGKEQHGSRHKIVDNVGEIVRQLLDLQLVTGGAVLGHLHDYTRLSTAYLNSFPCFCYTPDNHVFYRRPGPVGFTEWLDEIHEREGKRDLR